MASRQQEQQHNNHGSLCLSLMLSHPACLAAAGCDAKCVAAAMATCREARDAARAAHDVQRRAMEARVHNHGTIRSLQDQELLEERHWCPTKGVFVGGRDPTIQLGACEMVALMSVDAKNNEKRVLFTITLGCHDACPGAFCECTSNSFAVRALVHLTGMWQWVPVLTVFNIVRKRVGTPADPATPRVTYEAIAVASTGVERELNDALDLDDGELGFVVRALIQKSNVHHYKGTNPWSYLKSVHAWNKYRVQMPPAASARWTFCWNLSSTDDVAETGSIDPPPRSLDALDDDMARCFPRGWTCAAPDDDLPEQGRCKKIVTYIDCYGSFFHSLGRDSTSPRLKFEDNFSNHDTSPRHMVLAVEDLFIGDGPLADANSEEPDDTRIFTTPDFDELIAGWNREPPAEFESFELLEAWRDDIIDTRTVCAWAMVSRLEAYRGDDDDDDDDYYTDEEEGPDYDGVWLPRDDGRFNY